MELIDLPLLAAFSAASPSDCFAIDIPWTSMSPAKGLQISLTLC